MGDELRILNLEDSEIDAELIGETLRETWADCIVERVDTEAGFGQALERGGIDVILADYSLPTFNGISALHVVRQRFPDIPFIFVSGTLGEETAIDSLKSGATDYVLKHRLSRLVPAVQRALNEVAERSARKKAELERSQLESQLRHAQKMEAIGTLVTGISHDFNNLLNIITGYGTILLSGMVTGSRQRENMTDVLAAAERAVQLVKRLLIFSWKEALDIKSVNVAELLTGFHKMILRMIDEDIVLTVKILDKNLPVMADGLQIEQVLMNLVTNARDAMPNGGNLTIMAGVLEMNDAFIAAHGYGKLGKYVKITVSDTGCGMDTDIKGKIFEPFFTTKAIGKGTGLGLAVSYSIAKQHGGYLDVVSRPQEGAAFELYIPLKMNAVMEFTGPEVPAPLVEGNETILVAEDDAGLRQLIRIVLESSGYQVILAVDGEDAIARFKESNERIQLIFLDMIMPRKNGLDVHAEINGMIPGIKTLFSSGYPIDIAGRLGSVEGTSFIQKPFLPTALLQKIRLVLDA